MRDNIKENLGEKSIKEILWEKILKRNYERKY